MTDVEETATNEVQKRHTASNKMYKKWPDKDDNVFAQRYFFIVLTIAIGIIYHGQSKEGIIYEWTRRYKTEMAPSNGTDICLEKFGDN